MLSRYSGRYIHYVKYASALCNVEQLNLMLPLNWLLKRQKELRDYIYGLVLYLFIFILYIYFS